MNCKPRLGGAHLSMIDVADCTYTISLWTLKHQSSSHTNIYVRLVPLKDRSKPSSAIAITPKYLLNRVDASLLPDGESTRSQ